MPRKRAAVVIGVNTTGELTPLESPVDGANEVADWLDQEGFDVAILTDAKKPVTASAIKKAVGKFVNAGTYQQFVLYFSGHGYWKNNTELWLLSGAPDDADEAVSWVETVEFARESGITNVVIISDACRSIPQTVKANRVRGSVVFPNKPPSRTGPSKVDRLQASLVGASAYEVALSKKSKVMTSVFTHCLLNAYTNPDATMVLSHREGSKTIDVVPNRRLEGFLKREVARVLASVTVQDEQRPVIEVVSDEPEYIGQVRRPKTPPKARRAATRARGPVVPPSAAEIARDAVVKEIDAPPRAPRVGLRGAAVDRRRRRAAVTSPYPVAHFESETGFTVTGTVVQEVAASQGGRLDRPGDRHPNEAAVRIWMDPRSQHCSVAMTFQDGTGTVLPALRGYIGHITVADGGVSNVSYVPSDNSQRWGDYLQRKDEIETLRRAVATAARLGALRLGKEHARKFADRVRGPKQFDPSLGVYAAYAYNEAAAYDELRSVRRYMFEDLGTSLFDVAMLDRSPPSDWMNRQGRVPFCPMLSQGWYYLRARKIELPDLLDRARDELADSLWTTFSKRHMRHITRAVRTGRLK